jgi:tetratricopeptide (TPR) repeat protein
MEIKTAKNWYRWLWLSPLLTIPTLIVLYNQDLEILFQEVLNWSDGFSFAVLNLFSALWHLILLVPAFHKSSPFIRWHGWQAFALAGIRTIIPFSIAIWTGGDEFGYLLSIPPLLVVWFFGTLLSQHQANKGRCTLSRWFGKEISITPLPEEESPTDVIKKDPDALVEIIRYSEDQRERDAAVAELGELGLVEGFNGKVIKPIRDVRPSPVEEELPLVGKRGMLAWLIPVLVTAVLLGVSIGTGSYWNQAATATRQAFRTATIAEVYDTTATADAMQPIRQRASQWPVILSSDFESDQDVWETGMEDNELLNGNMRISEGAFLWDVRAKQDMFWWSIPTIDRTFFDFYLSVEFEGSAGSTGAYPGVIFRFIDEDNFYHFYWPENDKMNVYLDALIDGEFYELDTFSVPLGTNPFGVIQLTVIAEEDVISLFINEHYLGDIIDEELGYGEAGIIIGLDKGEKKLFSFDNFELRGPYTESDVETRQSALKLINDSADLAMEGEIEQALAAINRAQEIDPEISISAHDWNTVCWFGSLWGFAEEVLEACETAVRLEPDLGFIRDSRGVARAILGDFEGAIEDFQFYLIWAEEEGDRVWYIQKRKTWIEELEKGNNPFDAELLESLKYE